MLSTTRYTLLCCALLICAASSKAQDALTREVELEQVVITAERPLREKGLVVTEIDSSVLHSTLNSSMANLLANYSPVFIKNYGQGSLATASFRGTAASHTQVQWNGITLNSPMTGQVDFSLIPIFFIDKIELYHGGSSLQEGSGALGGSVVFASKPNWNKPFYGSFVQNIGSFSNYQTYLSVGGGGEKVQMRLRYFHDQCENDFWFYNNAIAPEQDGSWKHQQQTNAKYRKEGVLAELYWQAGNDNLISVNAWIQDSDRDLPPIMSRQGSGQEETQEDSEMRATASWQKFWKKSSAKYTFGAVQTELDYLLQNDTELGIFTNFDSQSKQQSLFNKYQMQFQPLETVNIEGELSYNYHKVDILDRKTDEGYNAERNEASLALNSHYELSKRMTVLALLRGEFVDGSFSPFIYTVGTEYQPLPTLERITLRANFTRNYHLPSLNDLYWVPGGNSDLKPEEGYSSTVGISYNYPKKENFTFTTSLDGFVSKIDDWIIWRPSEFRYWTADNIKKVYSRGIEYTLSTNYRWQKIELALQGNYAYTKTTNEEKLYNGDESAGKQLIYIPEHKANFLLGGKINTFYINYTYSFTGQRFTTSNNEETRHTLPAYALNAVSFGKIFHTERFNIDAQFKLNNIFNISYQSILYRPMPGINGNILIKIDF